MSTKVEELAGRELNIKVAFKVMGWQQWEHEKGDWEGADDVTFFADFGDVCGLSVYEPSGDGDVSYYFSPSTDIKDAYEMEEKIKERGLEGLYVKALKGLPTIKPFVTYFALIHASPLDRCRAALTALGEK